MIIPAKLFLVGLVAYCLCAFSFHDNIKMKRTDTEGDKIVGTWLNQEGTAHIQILRLESGAFAGKYFGKISWLKEPDENGKPKTDRKNPDKEKQSTPVLGLVILKNFVYHADDKEWTGGTIYDPKNGKTYSCTITLAYNNILNVRGYVGISLFGRTAVWTRVK